MRYDLLDILRGLAALWVFFYHLSDGFPASLSQEYPTFNAVCRVGHLGVEMFFVISGYCLMASFRSAIRNEESAPSFLYRRAMRIYPPFWFSVLAIVILPYVGEVLSAVKTGAWKAPTPPFLQFGVLEWLRYLTLTQAFFSGGAALDDAFAALNPIFWTLAIEVQFYVIMATAIALRPWSLHWLTAVTAIGIGCATVPSLYRTGIFLPYWPMFALGIGIYLLIERGVTLVKLLGKWATLFPLFFLIGLMMAIAKWDGFSIFRSKYPFTILFAICLWVIQPLDALYRRVKTEGTAARFMLRPFEILGAMSYSVYLLHGRLFILVEQIGRQLLGQGTLSLNLWTVAVTLVLCYPFHLLCERPFMHARPLSGRRRVIATGEIASESALGERS